MKLSDEEKYSEVKEPISNGYPNSISMPLVRRVFPELFANCLVSTVPRSSSTRNKSGGWKLNPAKEKKRIYHK